MWPNPTQTTQPTAGMFNFGQSQGGGGMSFGTAQPSATTGIFANQPATAVGTGLFNTGFNNPTGGTIPLPSTQANSNYGGFTGGMQAQNNGMGQPTGSTGLFGMGQTGMNGGVNPAQGMNQPNTIFSNPTASTGGIFGGATPNTGGVGMFGTPAANNNSMFGAKSQAGGTSIFGATSFGAPASPANTTGSFFGGASQPAANNIFGQATNTNNNMFGGGVQQQQPQQQNQQQQQQLSIFGGNKPTSGFLGNTQPTNSFGFAANTGSQFGTTNPSSFANNNAKTFQQKKFQPTKPKNDAVAKEKNANAVVACITNFDEYHQFCKEELRVMYLQNPQMFQSQPSFGQQNNTMFAQPANTGGMFNQTNSTFGQTATNTNGMFGQNQQPNNAGGMFNQPQQNTGGMFNQGFTGSTTNNQPFAAGSSLFGNPNQNSNAGNNSIFGANKLTPGAIATGNNLAASLFTTTNQPQQNTGGLFPTNNTGAGGLFNTPQQPQQQQGGTPMYGQQPTTLFGAPNNNNNNNQNSGSLFGGVGGGSLFSQPASTPNGGLFNTPGNNMANGQQLQQAVTTSVSMFANTQQQQQQQQSSSLFAPGSLFSVPQQQQQSMTQSPSLLNSTSLFSGMSLPSAIPNSNQQSNMMSSLLGPGIQSTRKNIFSSTSYYEATGSLPVRPATAAHTYSTDSIFVATPQVAQMSNLIASNLMNSLKDDSRYNNRDIYSQQMEDYELARKEIRRRFES